MGFKGSLTLIWSVRLLLCQARLVTSQQDYLVLLYFLQICSPLKLYLKGSKILVLTHYRPHMWLLRLGFVWQYSCEINVV